VFCGLSTEILTVYLLFAGVQVAASNAEQIERKTQLAQQECEEEMRIAEYIRRKDAREQVRHAHNLERAASRLALQLLPLTRTQPCCAASLQSGPLEWSAWHVS
jgi:hypothetical protein